MEIDRIRGAGMRQDVVERRWSIAEEVQQRRQVSVAQLSQWFDVSRATVRRDLAYLEQMGLLQRVHGGAQALSTAQQTFTFDARLLQNREIKRSIGKVAAGLIRPGDTAFFDSGTTVLEVARNIPPSIFEGGGLTAITRSLVIACEFRSHPQTRLVALGGIYVHEFDTFVGSKAEHALQEIHADVLFIGTDGVTLDRGLTTDNMMEAGLYPVMARCADQVVVVTDSSKIGVNQVQAILPLDAIHVFITDTGAPEGFVKALRDTGIEVVLVRRP
jgi:DeoR/GlpR family transcriptional regulator of sugar metabolism